MPVAVANENLNTVIVGTINKDKITGSSEGEILAGLRGKDTLKGGDGSDGFLFGAYTQYGKKRADTIRDFDPGEGDSLLVDKDAFGLGSKIKIKTVTSQKGVNNAKKSKNNFIYYEKKGFLYFNGNKKKSGWGDGGLFIRMQNMLEITAEDFTIV